jgi:hypothetical protein
MKQMTLQKPKQRCLGTGLVLLLFLLLLSACGTNAGTTTGSGSGATPTATPLTQHCGTVHTMRELVVPADQDLAKGVENCFWQAYQQCRPATLVYSQIGVDAGLIHNFSLKSQNGKCMITDALQHIIAPRPPQTAGTYTCASLTQQSDGLHFLACTTEGDVLVPA